MLCTLKQAGYSHESVAASAAVLLLEMQIATTDVVGLAALRSQNAPKKGGTHMFVGPPRLSRSVRTQPEFTRLLQAEKARTDRYGGSFAVLTFSVSPDSASARQARLLSVALADRLRTSDKIGWHEDGSLAALLSEADERGARTVARDVLARLRGRQMPLDTAIQLFS